ncbi:MAG: tetratricopeptide repeat protein, partial [Chitinispirillaceae bacterium]
MTAQSAEISVPYLEKRIKRNPNSRAFSRLADAYRRRGDLRQAIDLCIEGLAKHPDYTTARLILGRCYLEQKNYSAASGELKKVCIADRRNHAALMMLAEIFIQQEQEDLAANLYHILLGMEPENTRIKQLASQYVSPSRKKLFDLLEISTPDPASSLQSLKSSGVDEMTDIQNLDTIQSDSPPLSQQQADTAEPTAQDIENRLDLLFEEESQPGQKYEQTEPPVQNEIGFETASDSADDSSDTEVSGSDVSSRLDELFGDESVDDSDPFSLNSAETIQMNRDDLIQNTPEVDLPAPENQFEAETAGNQLFDFDAGETIQIDREELGSAMQKSPDSSQSPGDDDSLVEEPEFLDNGADNNRQNRSDEIQSYEDGIDTVQTEQDQSPSGEDIIETLDNIFGEKTDSPNAASEQDDPAPDSGDQKENVSGSDVENRLEELFPEAGQKESGSAVQEQEPEDLQNDDIFEIEDVSTSEEGSTTQSNDEVTGDDISKRLTDLFPDDTGDEVMDQVEDIDSEEMEISDSAVDFENTVDEDDSLTQDSTTFEKNSNDDDEITGADVEEQLDELFPQEDTLDSPSSQDDTSGPEISKDVTESFSLEDVEDFSLDKSSESEDKVTGADIEEQLDQLFPQEESRIDATEEEHSPEVSGLDQDESEEKADVNEDISGTDIEEKLDQLFPQEPEAQDSPSQDSFDSEPAGKEEIKETIQLKQSAAPFEERSEDENVSGTDVEEKLDQIFSQHENHPSEKDAGQEQKKD